MPHVTETLLPSPPLADAFRVRSRRRVRLGPVSVEICSNEPHFKGFRFFSESCAVDGSDSRWGEEPDFTLSLCNIGIDTPWPVQTLASIRDRSYRGKRLSVGYYLTDHFGAPAYLVTRGSRYWIFAEDFEGLLWPYAIKHLLTLYSIKQEMLHLKAAAVAVEGQGALLVGRGGSGKTVLMNHLCLAGAEFLSNTHVFVDGLDIFGIRTGMRVRADEFFGPMIAARGLAPNVKAGEYTADPLADLGWRAVRSAPLGCVCLVDYRGVGTRMIREMSAEVMFDYMEQFALALNVYGLKEDVLDSFGGDVGRFSEEMSVMRARLRAVVDGARCYYLSCDAADSVNLRAIWEFLRSPNRRPACETNVPGRL